MSDDSGPERQTLPPPVPVPEHEKRKHRRVALSLTVRFLRETGQEGKGQVLDMSAGGAFVAATLYPDVGETVVLYVDGVGRIEGAVVRHHSDGFAVRFEASPAKRERIAEKLIWEVNKEDLGLEDSERLSGSNGSGVTRLRLPDGQYLPCSVLHMSMTGLSIQVPVRPPVGAIVTVGRLRGRITGHHDQGVSIDVMVPGYDC